MGEDVREAPSIRLAKVLLELGATVVGHDPEAGPGFAAALRSFGSGRVEVVERDYDALDNADGLVLLTEWLSYRAPNFAEMRRRLRGPSPALVDARNVWRPSEVQKAGLRYIGVGVPPGLGAPGLAEGEGHRP
jgi:UDPglucose 6-dehydrogenase